MPNQSLYLRLLRKGATSDADDVIQIKCQREDVYSVTYTYGESAKPTKGSYTAYLDGNSTYQYVRTLLQLLQQDVDPFEFAQFDFPLMPSILFKIDTLKGREYHTILDALDCHLKNQTPCNDYSNKSNAIANTHLYFSDSD
jgi:hypothetical protein